MTLCGGGPIYTYRLNKPIRFCNSQVSTYLLLIRKYMVKYVRLCVCVCVYVCVCVAFYTNEHLEQDNTSITKLI